MHGQGSCAVFLRRYVTNIQEYEEDDEEDPDPGYISPGSITRALVLALSVCYHARLQDRKDYEEGVVEHFIGPINLPGGSQQFTDEIRWYGMGLMYFTSTSEIQNHDTLTFSVSCCEFTPKI